ncbi:MAG: N-acetylmuramoyl-L-alanine amidase [Anaerolineales bacterium]|nr:N-acetylmuramoyl-L-alanine amidase [Anaerolineales bacterium]
MDPFEHQDYQPESPRARTASMNVLSQLLMVFGVAALLATMFTAWTPLGLVPSNLAAQLVEIFWGAGGQSDSGLPQPTPRPRPLIGILAGHSGGADPGAVCPDGLTEVSINLDVATRVKEKLTASGFDVDLLEEFDARLDGYQAMLLVAVHADSCAYIDDNASGFKVAAATNIEDSRATRLSACLSDRYGRVTGLRYHIGSVSAHMTGYHVFGRIDLLTAAAIIEVGFMNLDRQILTQQPDLLAEGIAQGVLCYIYNEDASGGG